MRIAENTRITRQRQLFYIVALPLVELLRAEGFSMPQPPIRFYPDGSLWTDDNKRLLRINSRNVLETPKPLIGCASSRFRPLATFGGDRDAPNYQVLSSSWCDWMGEHENWALTYPGIGKNVTEDEYDLSNVRVLIKLRRKFTAALAEELAGVLRQWFIETGSQRV
jgi:hypothetical protein